MTKKKVRESIFGGDEPVNTGDQDESENVHETKNAYEKADPDDLEPMHYRDFALGDIIYGNGAMECVEQGKAFEVKQNDQGRLYVDCEQGQHFLDRCADEHDNIYGFAKKKPAPEPEEQKEDQHA